MYIETMSDLRALVKRIKGTPHIAIDTEFVRERQYFPQLEIIQIATETEEAILDYRVLQSLDSFGEVLDDTNTLKIFHAASQDLEILFNLMGRVPKPLFDTQVAAAMVGLGPQIGYSRLVEGVMGVALSKSETLTDWTRRPLTNAQKEYALDDVRYLLPVYQWLDSRLQALGRQDWLKEEWAEMSDPALYRRADPREAYRRISGMNKLKPTQLAVLRELAEWREKEAVRRDRPAGVVLKDAVLIEIARRAPRTLNDLRDIRALLPRDIERSGEALLESVQRGRATPRHELPHIQERTNLTGQESGLVTLLQAYLRARSEELGIAPSYLATTTEVQEFVAATQSERLSAPMLHGWRRRVVGTDLVALIEGEVGLSWSPEEQRLTLTPVEFNSHDPSDE
jgi:ribonuclease D